MARSYKIQKACYRGNKSHDQPNLSLFISSLSLSICLFPSDRRGLRWSTRHEIRRRDAAWGDRARRRSSGAVQRTTACVGASRAQRDAAHTGATCTGAGSGSGLKQRQRLRRDVFIFFISSAASRPWKFISRGQPRYPLLQIVFVAAIT